MKNNKALWLAVVTLLCVAVLGGCNTYRTTPVNPSVPTPAPTHPYSSAVPNPVTPNPSVPNNTYRYNNDGYYDGDNYYYYDNNSRPYSSSLPNTTYEDNRIRTGNPSDLPALSMSADFLEIGALDNKKVVWGPGNQTDKQSRPTAPVQLQAQYGEEYNCDFIAPAAPVVTLSFDQGYENGYTAAILDTLSEKQVRAVFFLTGHYVRSQPELVQRMLDEGHILGNHTNNHLNFTECSLEEAFEDVRSLHEMVREQFGYEMRIFRFPEGEFSVRSLALLEQMGYRSLFWSFAYNDWNPDDQMEPDDALEKVTGRLHPGEIMLLHSVGRTNSVILGDLIDAIRAKGYDVRPYDAIENF